MSEYYRKQRRNKSFEENSSLTLYNSYIKDECKERLIFALPSWMKEEAKKIGNYSQWLRDLMEEDFKKRGIERPQTEQDLQLLQEQMRDFE